MEKFIKKNKIGLILIVPGAIAGFLYWKFVGCYGGTCPITSVWHNTTLAGGLMGFFLGGIIDDLLQKRKRKVTNDREL